MADRLLNKRQVAEKANVSTKTIERKVHAGLFPHPIEFAGPRWPESIVDQWIEKQHECANDPS